MNFRSALLQVYIIGFLAFCCPGMFNALNGLGGAGSSDSSLAAAANATLYGCFAVFGYFGGVFFNLFGPKILMFVGGGCYAIYAVGQYLAGVYDSLKWMAVLSGAILGFGAGWFWTAQGAMMMAYATPSKKGNYISIFWIVFNLGAMIGGFLTFGLNFSNSGDSADQANPVSYFVFVGIMALGAISALFLLANPSSVIREDNEQVVFEKAQSAIEEIKGAFSVSMNKYMLLLIIPFLSSNWFYTYQFNGYNANLFNIRTRGLNSAFYWGSQMLGAWSLGKVLDKSNWDTKKRGIIGLIVLGVEFNLTYILGLVIQYFYDGGFERKIPFASGKLDVTQFGLYIFPLIVYFLYGVGDAMLQTYAYWVMAAVAKDDTTLCARFAGFYKGVQSLGACVAWAIDLGVDYKPQFWICWVLFIISIPLMYLVAKDLTEDNRGGANKELSHQAHEESEYVKQ